MRPLRRSDRGMPPEEAFRVLHAGEYGVLSTVGPEGHPYGLPLNYCILGTGIYFHCAPEGQKIDHFTAIPEVSFCVVGRAEVLPGRFSTRYESVIVSGRITEVFAEKKQQALEGLVAKYSGEYFEEGLAYIASSHEKTRVFRISMDTVTGKVRR